ncbi:acyltransferase [Phormidium sp. CCY1219]|uniref:acyltransferase n=1 Tax=Phormidium sp. CCY1219 TaxID=2886104 RepID=UPI002D1EEDFC|nr:DapH/DapD/GlmU-related protein [Phormidium sp. CCY1219]MEB3828326.1 acyltransferase [Phormidium sp. CCY1219]
MNPHNYSANSSGQKPWKIAIANRLFRLIEGIEVPLLQWVPFPFGSWLRTLAYRSFVAKLGKKVTIETGVEFVGACWMKVGNEVFMSRDVRLRTIGRRNRIEIGDRVSFDRGVDIKAHGSQGPITIGDRTYIGPYTCLSGCQLTIGKDCLIASHSSIYSNNHVFSDFHRNINEQGNSYSGIVIEDNCWLGTGVKVLDGVKIGTGSVIGAGAVVTKEIPPYSIAVGMPAKVISRREAEVEEAVKSGRI